MNERKHLLLPPYFIRKHLKQPPSLQVPPKLTPVSPSPSTESPAASTRPQSQGTGCSVTQVQMSTKQNFEERLFNFLNGSSLDIIKLSKHQWYAQLL